MAGKFEWVVPLLTQRCKKPSGRSILSLTLTLSFASIWYIPISLDRLVRTRKETIMTELFAEAAVLAWVVLVLMVTGEAGAGERRL